MNGKSYVCECYSRYYELALHDRFTRDKRCVTATGSPGIGKSMFYGYFFNRFQRDKNYRGFAIITASFSNDSELKNVVAFKDGKKIANFSELIPYAFLEWLSATVGPEVFIYMSAWLLRTLISWYALQ
ncbi:hypothetical protein PPTG_20118, partial [Phytophthora nicotianae INRA-310]